LLCCCLCAVARRPTHAHTAKENRHQAVFHLTMPQTNEILIGNMNGMILTGKKPCAGIKTCPGCNRKRSEMISNRGIRREKPATNRLRKHLFENIFTYILQFNSIFDTTTS